MSERTGNVTYRHYDLDEILVDAERCLKCESEQGCISHCSLGLEIPKTMAAIVHRAFVVRSGAREEQEEKLAERYAREAVEASFSRW
jgi:hypothetical protein